ncbi:protein kinase [bacterium]|nr:protein kinase [bacterium]
MLTDQDVLLLKLSLERELLDGVGYRRVIDTVRGKGSVGGVGRALRVCGVAGERVGELAELVAAAGKDPSGAILARSDLEDVIVAKAIGRSKLLPDDKIERARGEQRGMARTGELTSLTEILVKRRWLEVPVAVELRRRARERIATCPRCWRHYVVDPKRAEDGRFHCTECQGVLLEAAEMRSAIEVARGLPPERPPPPIEASLLQSSQTVEEPPATPPRPVAFGAPRASSRPNFFSQSPSPRTETKTPPTTPPAPAAPAAAPAPPPDTKRLKEAARVATRTPPAPSPHATPSAPASVPQPDTKSLREAARVATRTPPQPAHANAPATPAAPSDAFTPPSSVTGRRFAARASTEEIPALRESAEADDPSSVIARTARWDSLEDLEEAAPDVPAVATFGEYEILTEVARGGMGIVYKARRKGSSKALALKVLISGVDATEDQVRRFEREGEAARRLRHKGIVRVYDAGRHEGYHYIAMEYVEGKTLEDVLSTGPLPPERAAKIMAAVADAVDHMHAAAIIHRDLKPGNVMLDSEDEPKLIDFGLAKAIDRRAKLTRSGAAIGTPYYMPPEQVRGETDRIGPTSDVYALGAIFYEMITGEPPFQAENPIELYHKIASSELVMPDALVGNLPRDLVTITAKCLEKKQEDRYETSALLAADLRHWLDGEPVSAQRRTHAPPEETSEGKEKKVARKGGLVLAFLGVAVVLGLLAAGGKYLLPRLKARDYQQDGQAALARHKVDDARVFFERALELLPHDPSLEVDLARAVAAPDPQLALGLVEQAEKDGLLDAESLSSPELKPISNDPRFKEVVARVSGGRQ